MEPQRPPQPSPPPPTPQSWELPAGVGPTRGYGAPPPLGAPSSAYAPPNKRSFLGLGILGIFALLVVMVIVACVIAFFAFRDTITSGLKDVTSGFGGGTPATVVVDGKAMTVQQEPICHKDSDGMIRMSIDSSQSISATLSDGNPPEVANLNLGKHDGVLYIYTPNDKGSATATRDGNTFKIVGAMSSQGGVPTGTFEIDVTCPRLK